MNYINRIAIIDTFYDIFTIKAGKIIKKNNICYQTSRWTSIFYKIYYGGPVFFLIMALYLGLPHFFNNIYIQMFETLFIFLLIEIVALYIVPISKVDCWKKSLDFRTLGSGNK